MIRLSLLLLVWSLLLPCSAWARARDLDGHWYRVNDSYHYAREAQLPRAGLSPVETLNRTGGTYFYEADFTIDRADTYVIDFQNSTTIGRFRHFVFDARGRLIDELAGGIQDPTENPFLLRHGRDLELTPGRYRLISELDSPFLLAQPEPFLQSLREYRRDIKSGNALALGALGVLAGLGFYYAALALSRRRLADLMYVLFIAGNLLYNGSALLLFSDLLGLHWFYLVSVPILFSNAAYVLFVVALLEIDARETPWLHRGALALLGLFAAFAVAAALFPNWSLEFDRYGVGLFTSYGLVAAVVRTRAGHSSAQWYLVAISAFFVLSGVSISLSRVAVHALYVEHLGLLAVVVEAALLALVLAQQFSLLHDEKTSAERRAREGFKIAHCDALTGLPNRYSLDKTLKELPLAGSLTFIDMDGLKHYNDQYGHQRGDQLLCSFASALSARLGKRAVLYRLSGDEFAVLSETGDIPFIAEQIDQAVGSLRQQTFQVAGASFGSVLVSEDPSRENLKHIADTRMYENKRVRRASAPAEWLRPVYPLPRPSAQNTHEASSVRRSSSEPPKAHAAAPSRPSR